jgi:putative transposase
MSATKPHRKLVKHYHEPDDRHELTLSCYKRQPLLTNDLWRQHLDRARRGSPTLPLPRPKVFLPRRFPTTAALTTAALTTGSRCVDAAGQEVDFRLAAFVFMPEHVQLLVVPMLPDPAIDRYLARIKQPFSKWVKEQLIDAKSQLVNRMTVHQRPGKTCFRFWQEGPG